MKERYHIIPQGNGYLVMGLTDDNVYIQIHKSVANLFESTLTFPDAETAQKYIEEYLDIEKYEIEPFWIREETV